MIICEGLRSNLLYIYRPQTKFAKVMFLQVSVCPHGGGMRGFIRRGAYMVLFGGNGVVLFGGHVWFYLGGCVWFYLGGLHGFIWGRVWFYSGACMVLFGGACVVLFGGHAWFYSGGACVVFSVFSDTMRYGQ